MGFHNAKTANFSFHLSEDRFFLDISFKDDIMHVRFPLDTQFNVPHPS